MRTIKVLCILSASAIILTGCSISENDAITETMDCLLSDKQTKNVQLVTEKGTYVDKVTDAAFSQMIANRIDYNVLDMSTNGNISEVEMSFSYPDMVSIIDDYVSEQTETSFDEWFTKKYTDSCPMLQETISVDLKKVNGKWEFVISEELSNILTGGLLEYKYDVETNAYQIIVEE